MDEKVESGHMGCVGMCKEAHQGAEQPSEVQLKAQKVLQEAVARA